MCTNIGHNNQKVIKAIQDQAAELAFVAPSFATKPRAELGEILKTVTPPGLDKFFYTLGGAEAVENAIKFARFHTGKHKIIARTRSYHGATYAAISLTGDYRRWANEPGMSGIVRVDNPYMYRSYLMRDGMSEEEFTAVLLAQLEEVITQENPDAIAAMIIEPVTGSNGVIIPPKGYLPGLRALLSKYNIMMIADEVMAGFGRCGEWFSVDHWKVVPDIITMAKGITSAYTPLGAVAINRDIAKTFETKPFFGGLTYNSHPLSLASAVATLNVFKEEKIIENAREQGKVMAQLHAELKAKHKSVGDARSIGLFGCLELVKNRKTKEPMSINGGPVDPAVGKLIAHLKEKGVFAMAVGHLLLTNPPLVITKKQLEETFAVFDEALAITDAASTE
jgi:taurine--2-oxoglutarate transaminase